MESPVFSARADVAGRAPYLLPRGIFSHFFSGAGK